MKIFILLFALSLSVASFSQEEKEEVVMQYQAGKEYIVHVAEAGNTLYGMHTLYGVAVDDIVKANPGIEKGVKVGTAYLIPHGAATVKVKDGTKLIHHTVVKGETPYGLAKKYGADLNELNSLNPAIAQGLKLGQTIYIPFNKVIETPKPVEHNPNTPVVETKVEFKDSIVSYTVKNGDTFYGIAKRYMVSQTDLQKYNNLKSTKVNPGDVLKIPIKKEMINQVAVREIEVINEEPKVDTELLFTKKESYKIAVLLPFGLDGKGSASLKNLATEYYMGMNLALDSLEAMGIKATIQVIDFPIDSAEVVAALKKPEMKTMDLIIGPLVPSSVDLVGVFCKQNKIRMVCPTSVNTSVLKDNPFVYTAVTSEITQQKILARYTTETYKNAQVVLVNLNPSKDKDLYEAYRSKYNELAKTSGNPKLIEAKLSDFTSYIRKNGNTVFVVPSTDKALVWKFIDALHKARAKAGDGEISVMGTKDWASFEDLNGYYKTTYNVQWATSSDLNYSMEQTEALLRVYRSEYKADMSRVAVQGYDVMMYFAPYLLQEKINEESLIQNAFNMTQVGVNCGFENNQCFILKHEEYELVRKGIYHE